MIDDNVIHVAGRFVGNLDLDLPFWAPIVDGVLFKKSPYVLIHEKQMHDIPCTNERNEIIFHSLHQNDLQSRSF